MGKKALKVVIAGRNYPLTINEDEEDTVIKAVERINTSVKNLQENYAVKDIQDLLAMTALKLATQAINQPIKQDQDTQNKEMDEIFNDLKRIAESLSV